MNFLSRKIKALRQDEQGFSLAELGVYGGLAALLLGAVLTNVRQPSTTARSNATLQEFASIIEGTNATFQGQAAFPSADITATIGNAGNLPSGQWDGSNASNRFGGTYTVTGAGASATLSSPAIPQNTCIQALSRFPIDGANVVSVAVNGGSVSTTQLTATEATSACNVQGVAGNNISIVFTKG